ncbi:MAG TPA: hypothetical protein PLA83_01315 [Deltaproteobacteria bacterium]|jgi:hypothetical protein|nr:hypothetical protein [Deltaproteobacteria bacterium]HQI00629.1 hypothetical protein [Deltaproteobacteria bacterium]HQJ09981.1 hypothetical protein [Deltaproteobacteria bacterium]
MANAIDHTPVLPGENRVFGEQLGPNRTARAFAIVQIAVYDAVNAIDRSYESYTEFAPGTKGSAQYAAYSVHNMPPISPVLRSRLPFRRRRTTPSLPSILPRHRPLTSFSTKTFS